MNGIVAVSGSGNAVCAILTSASEEYADVVNIPKEKSSVVWFCRSVITIGISIRFR